ncbi:MAG: SbcC/MukB-like Walker B domain-containing protein [Lachnospiraceae bacterium]
MRPTYLELSAFGPFAGKVEIPFEDIVSEGVFLIHGATGAGKTTIFDAISFALFGNASGENRPTDSLRSDFAADDVPTYVIFRFTHGGKSYSIERKPAYRRPKQRGEGFTESKADAVFTFPDGIVVTGYQNVTDKVEELLSVDWRQFKQLSMIAQGEFTKLLTVESKERGEIFRKIFHTGELGRIGKTLKERMLKLKRVCEDTDNVIVQYYMGIECPEQEQPRSRIDSWKEQPDIHKAGEFQELLADIVAEDRKEYASCQSEVKSLEEELSGYQVMEAKLSELQKKKDELELLLLQQENTSLEEAENEEDKRRLFFAKKAVSAVRPQKEAYSTAKREREELFAMIESREKQLAQLKTQEEDIILHYHKAQADKAGLEELLVRMEQAKNEVKNAGLRTQLCRQREEKLAEYEEENRRFEEKKQRIQELEDECGSCRHAVERLAEIYRQGTELERREREIKQWSAALTEQKERFKSYETTKKNYERLTGLLTEKLERQQCLEAELSEAERIYLCEQAGVLADHLKEGEACPVCGSLTHPEPAVYTAGAPTREELEQRRAEVEEFRKETAELSKEAAMEKSTMLLLLEYLSRPRDNTEPPRFDSMEGYEQEEAKLKDALQNVLAEIEALLKEQETCMRAKDRVPELEEKLALERRNLDLLQGTLLRITSELQGIENDIKKLTLELTVADEEEAEKRLAGLQAEHEQKKQEISSAETAYYEWDNQRQSEAAVLEQLLGQKTARAMKEQNARETYLSALKSAGFDTEADYDRAVLNEAQIEELEEKTAKREAELLKRRERIRFLQQEVSHSEWKDTGFVRKQIEDLKARKNVRNERISVLYNRIETNEKIRVQAEKQIRIRKQLQKEYGSIFTLSAVANGELPGKDRLPFEQYVQAFYFEQVIYEANHRLKQMSGGRYALLRKKEADNKRSVTGLDLEIMDYFTGKARSVKSLSGGESFKAALSLALGLSDVIQSYAGGVIVETMFIDEGFGSLDKDSLEQAVALLKTLATDHRIVGIISHVEELKECIEKKIQLEKGIHGSTICF